MQTARIVPDLMKARPPRYTTTSFSMRALPGQMIIAKPHLTSKQKFPLTDTEDRLQWPGGEGKGCEFGVSRKLVHTGLIVKRGRPGRTIKGIEHPGINHDGKEYRKRVYVCNRITLLQSRHNRNQL